MRSKLALFERWNLKRLLPPGVSLVPMLLLVETCPFPTTLESPVAQVTIVADQTSLSTGSQTQVRATVTDASGNVLTDQSVTWSSGNTSVATVLPSSPTAALVTGVGAGSTKISAVAEGKSGAVDISVASSNTTASVASVTVTLGSASLVAGSSTTATATLKDSLGNVLSGRSVFWWSSNVSAATVVATGPTTASVTAVAEGSAVIKGSSESAIGTASLSITAPSTCLTSSGTWQNASITPQTGSFEARFDATPANANMDGVVGLASGAASDYTQLATIVRFNREGTIDARNGGTYSTASAIPYSAGTTYHFRLNVDIASHTYDIYVTPAGGSETVLGRGFFFRTEQAAVGTLDRSSVYASLGSVTACNLAVSAWTPPAVASVTVSPASASLPVGQTLRLTATLKDANGNVLNGRTVTWASSALSLATVSSSGLVTGLAVGSPTITATSEGWTGSSAIQVELATTTGNHYYVAPTGSDANACSAASPCFTMQRVSQLLRAGDTAHFAPGNYSWSAQTLSASGTASARITYISDTKWGAKIGGSCAIIRNSGDYVDIVGFDITGTCATGLSQNGNYGRIIGNRVHDLPGTSGYAGILVDCCNFHLTGNQVIGNVVDNIGPFGETNLIHGIYAAGPNTVIMNNIVTRASAACITSYHGTTRLVISNNVVANCGRYGIQISADGGLTTNDYTTVNNNIVVNVADSGGYGYGIQEYPAVGSNNVYYNNIVYNNRVNLSLISGTASGTITLTSTQFAALFVNYTGDMHGDYRLRAGAVGIDRGATTCASGVSRCVPAIDFDGIARPLGAAHDIGAFEQ